MLVADQRASGFEPTLDAGFVASAWARPDFELGDDAGIVNDGIGAVVAYRADLDAIGLRTSAPACAS